MSEPILTTRKTLIFGNRLISKFKGKLQAVKSGQPALRPTTVDQSQSILFRLPFEIREQILKAVLGDRIIHIKSQDGRLGHVRCGDKQCGTWEMGKHECWDIRYVNIGAVQCHNSYTPLIARSQIFGTHLGIIMTCRQIYDEALPLLYTSNIISIQHLHQISQLRTVFPPRHLNLITSLHLCWTIDWRAAWTVYPPIHGSASSSTPEDQPTWLNAWQFLASFDGLKVLRIEITDRKYIFYPAHPVDLYPDVMQEDQTRLLNAMCCIKQVKSFEVRLPWKMKDMGFVIEQTPFTLLGDDGVIWERGKK